MEEAMAQLKPIVKGAGMYHGDLLNGHHRSLTMVMDFEEPVHNELSQMITAFRRKAEKLGVSVEIGDQQE